MLRRYYHFILQRRGEFFLGVGLFVVATLLSNTAPFFIKWITQELQANHIDQALWLVFFFGLILLVSNIIANLAYLVTDKNVTNTSIKLSAAVLAHIHNLDFAYHTNKSSGKLISLMKRGDEAFFTYYDILNIRTVDILTSFLVMLGAMFQLKLHYVIFVGFLLILSFFLSRILVAVNIAKRQHFNHADDDLSAVRVDNLVNFDTVKYFANEEFEQQRFGKYLGKWKQTLMDYFFTFRYFDLVIGNLINIALAGILMLGIWDLQRQVITLPDFLLISTFSLTLFPKMMGLLYNLRDMAKKHTDLETYLNLLDEPVKVRDPEIPESIEHPKGEIIFENIAFRYENDAPAVLKDFSLHIKHGESIAFVGYSGAGKTTIAKLLMRMYDPQDGMLKIDGVDIKKLRKADLRSIVGIVPQDPLLFNNTIYYNIAYAKSTASEDDVISAAKKARVHDFVQKLPKTYQTVVGERGIKLSGGQRQRLAVARVLLEKPQVIIFDEATSALDSVSEQTIQAAFWDMVRDPQNPRTSIIIAHRLSTIMKADRIVVMDKGSIVAIGTHEKLMKDKDGIYSKLWSLQRNGFIGDGESEE